MLKARELPEIRRKLVAWYSIDQPGGFIDGYATAIRSGNQVAVPPGVDVDHAARLLAAHEVERLDGADLWFIDEDLCALVDSSFASMPGFVPAPHHLPSKAGLVLFAQPIAIAQEDDEAMLEETAARVVEMGVSSSVRAAAAEMIGEDLSAEVRAVSWGPLPPWAKAQTPAGGLWITYYTDQSDFLNELMKSRQVPVQTKRFYKEHMPPLALDNESLVRWLADHERPEDWSVDEEEEGTTIDWAKMLFATFMLATQSDIGQIDELAPNSKTRRAAEAHGVEPAAVRLIRLRNSDAAERSDPDAAGRWSHRWVVRGHWRRQWYPATAEHRPIWIAPHVKGPDHAPIKGGDKVHIASGQRTPYLLGRP